MGQLGIVLLFVVVQEGLDFEVLGVDFVLGLLHLVQTEQRQLKLLLNRIDGQRLDDVDEAAIWRPWLEGGHLVVVYLNEIRQSILDLSFRLDYSRGFSDDSFAASDSLEVKH